MATPKHLWVNTTHDWSAAVDADHLAGIRRDPGRFAPGGPWHLVLEVLAYAADEAASRGAGRCLITLHPDGHPRRGMSVVAALSEWLVHTNRRADGAWTQRYAHGVPTGDLTPVAPDGTTGTQVHFRPDALLVPRALPAAPPPAAWPRLDVRVEDRRA